ncbi:MAG: DUF4123 domain-containing protein [Polyangiaceae bacterium]|nr:DUF4123 domain-containing protein [Polyangiaceae bacterium]
MEPRCVVEIRWGPLAGTKAVIPPGGALRVGRSDRADLAVPRDPKLSALHFRLTWDGRRCAVEDLESVAGTLLGGAAIAEAEVPHGAWLQAGYTDFTVHVEAHTPPPAVDEATLPGRVRYMERKRLASAQAALSTLRSEQRAAPLWAVLDASRGPRLLTLCREAVEPHRSLYQGARGDALEDVAPYLVGPFQPDSSLLERLVLEGWEKGWGIYFTCRSPLVELRRHLRRFLVVEIHESGERIYFRYYDPRVLRRFLPTCSPRQEEEIFGDIDTFLVEGERGELRRLSRRPAAAAHT